MRSGTNIGFVKIRNNKCIVIDTGLDDDYGRRISKIIQQLGCSNTVIINTHSHADHIGGNRFLYNRLGLKIYAHPHETIFIKNTELMTTILYGAPPPRDLKTKLLYPKPVPSVENVYELPFINKLDIIELPGHTPGMIGLSYENVLFTADTFFNKKILDKYKIPFHFDNSRALESLKKLKSIIMNKKFKHIIPSHGEILSAEKALELIDYNIMVIENLREVVKNIIYENNRVRIEDLLSTLLSMYGVDVKGVGEYYLLKTCIKSYISWLRDNGFIDFLIEDNKLFIIRSK